MTAAVAVASEVPRRVLVVDDDADFAASLVDLLEPLGFAVRTAGGVGEALGTLSSFAADLALVDVKLGKENGLVLVPELKGRRPAITCILMTAYAALDSAVEAVRVGVEDYLLKPLEPTELIEKVRRTFTRNEDQRRRELEQRLILLGDVCAGIAHDVNSCLQTMLSDVDDVQAALTATPVDVERAMASSGSLGATVHVAANACRRILTFARGSTAARGCDASAALQDASPVLERLLPAAVMLVIRAPEQELRVALDAAQFQQIVGNLVLNGIHAVGERGRIGVALEVDDRGPTRVARLRVTDDGRGIAESVLPRIFDPYFSTRSTGDGAGLGLSIVHGLVKAAGGEIRVESEPGRGSRFEVLLPLVDSSAVERRSESPRTRTTKPKRLLIVDDLEPILLAMEKRFRMAGYLTACASSAEEASPLVDELGDGLAGVITDVRLPGLSGIQLAEYIRERWPSLPIVLISGDAGNLPELKKLGPQTALLHKPFELADLLACLEGLIATA